MNLHNNKDLLQDAVLATADYLAMREIYVEKDYWVTVALYEIFHSDIADQSVFFQGWYSTVQMPQTDKSILRRY